MHDGHLLSTALLHIGMVQPVLWAIFQASLGASEYCGTGTPSWCLGFWSYRPNFACLCNVDDPACTRSIFEAGSGKLQYLVTSWCLGICNDRSPFSNTDPCYKQPDSVMTEISIFNSGRCWSALQMDDLGNRPDRICTTTPFRRPKSVPRH